MISYRKDFIHKDIQLWLRAPLWYQMPYDKFMSHMLEYLVDEQKIEFLAADKATIPEHVEPYKPSSTLLQSIKENLAKQLQPGVSIEDACTGARGDLLSDMPLEMADRRRELSKKVAIVLTHEELEQELLRRLHAADIKFFLRKFNQAGHGTKAVLMQRLVHAMGPAIEKARQMMVRAQNSEVAKVGKYVWEMCRREVLQNLGELFYVKLRTTTIQQSVGSAQPSLLGERIGDAVDPTHMEGILNSILSVSTNAFSESIPLVYIYRDRVTQEKRVEAFIDMLLIDRSKIPLGGHFSVRFSSWRNQPYDKCPHGVHTLHGSCKCHMPTIFVGQDECIFKSYAMSSRVWVLGTDEGGECRAMRKKGM